MAAVNHKTNIRVATLGQSKYLISNIIQKRKSLEEYITQSGYSILSSILLCLSLSRPPSKSVGWKTTHIDLLPQHSGAWGAQYQQNLFPAPLPLALLKTSGILLRKGHCCRGRNVCHITWLFCPVQCCCLKDFSQVAKTGDKT